MKLTEIVSTLNSLVRVARFVGDFTGGTRCVDGVAITNPGTGYSASFAVSFSGGGGSGAAGTASVDGGAVISVAMTNRGSGYTSTPSPSFAAGSGTGAAGTSIMAAKTLDAIVTVGVDIGGVYQFANGGIIWPYLLDAGTDAESVPAIVRPDDYNGATNQKVFRLLNPRLQLFDWKESVRAATTANITLSGAQTIDGVSVIAGDRVLVKNQTTGSENGIYVAAAGAWARSADADTSAEVTSGLAVVVTEGTVTGDTLWVLTTNDPITLGSTSLVFAQLGGTAVPSGAAGGDLSGTYPNPTVAQSSIAFALNGVLSPSSIGSSQNDYDPASLSTANTLRLTASTTVNITGLAGGASGRMMTIHNIGSNAITLVDESASSSAANRFALLNDVVLNADAVCLLQYDSTSTRWRGLWAGGGHTIQEEGSGLTSRPSLNFIGAEVTAADDAGNNATTVTVVGLKGFTLENPVVGENVGVFSTAKAMTITSVKAVVKGAGSPSITFNLRYGTDRSAAGTAVFASDQAISSTSALVDLTITNSAIPANGILWLTTSASAGTVTELTLAIELR